MSDVLKFDSLDKKTTGNLEDYISTADDMLNDVRTEIREKASLSMPITEIAALGAGVASLLPSLRTATETVAAGSDAPLFKVVNMGNGQLKWNKTKEFVWPSIKNPDGSTPLAKLVPVDSDNKSVGNVMPVDPALLMVAVALFSIEKKLSEISETEKQILSFLEYEKRSEIEADVLMLEKIIKEYKYNWDNEKYLSSNHKMVLDIQRTARKNMVFYQKSVTNVADRKKHVSTQTSLKSVKEKLINDFLYFRLSLFSFSMASLIAIMLSGNFDEEYITGVKSEIDSLAIDYRMLFSECSTYLENLSRSSVETNLLKGVGKASDAVGVFIKKIPVIEKGPVDELLQDSGTKIKKKSLNIENESVKQFAELSNPGIRSFIDHMDELKTIYNQTSDVYFDDKTIYLIAG